VSRQNKQLEDLKFDVSRLKKHEDLFKEINNKIYAQDLAAKAMEKRLKEEMSKVYGKSKSVNENLSNLKKEFNLFVRTVVKRGLARRNGRKEGGYQSHLPRDRNDENKIQRPPSPAKGRHASPT